MSAVNLQFNFVFYITYQHYEGDLKFTVVVEAVFWQSLFLLGQVIDRLEPNVALVPKWLVQHIKQRKTIFL